MALTTSAFAARPCPPDISCNGVVNMDDLIDVVNNWGHTGTNLADLNESGTVDIDDLITVVNAWGPCLFDYGPARPNHEANQIGLEMMAPGGGAGGALTVSNATYQRIVRDLNLIRAQIPTLMDQAHAPAWVANEIIVGLKVAPARSQFECLNTFYRVTDRSLLFTVDDVEYWVLVFAGDVNVPALAASYAALPDVVVAEPNFWSVGENTFRPTDLGNGTWVWDIDDGFVDCVDGCDCHRMYLIETHAEGGVMLLGQNKQGAGWCGFHPPTELAAAGTAGKGLRTRQD